MKFLNHINNLKIPLLDIGVYDEFFNEILKPFYDGSVNILLCTGLMIRRDEKKGEV